MRKLEQEAFNLVIEPRGASFKVLDPGKIHQDRIFAVAAAAYMLEQLKLRMRPTVVATSTHRSMEELGIR